MTVRYVLRLVLSLSLDHTTGIGFVCVMLMCVVDFLATKSFLSSNLSLTLLTVIVALLLSSVGTVFVIVAVVY